MNTNTMLTRNQVIAINCDNASNNDTMSEDIEARSMAEGFEFDAQESRLRCMPHTVHLAALEVSNLASHKETNKLSLGDSCLWVLVPSNATRKTKTRYIRIR